jgi:phosphate starvation-inducible PhoH-like protein
LFRALKILRNIDGISIVELDTQDVVRHKLVKEIIKAYDKADEQI